MCDTLETAVRWHATHLTSQTHVLNLWLLARITQPVHNRRNGERLQTTRKINLGFPISDTCRGKVVCERLNHTACWEGLCIYSEFAVSLPRGHYVEAWLLSMFALTDVVQHVCVKPSLSCLVWEKELINCGTDMQLKQIRLQTNSNILWEMDAGRSICCVSLSTSWKRGLQNVNFMVVFKWCQYLQESRSWK